MADIIASKYLVLDGVAPRIGGLSVVRKAVDISNGSSVAIKLVQGATDQISRKVFDRETKSLASLDHTNVVRLIDSGIDETGTYYLALEWCDVSLDNVLSDTGAQAWGPALEKFGMPIAAGMSHAHLKGVENRDIKPSNILIRQDGSPVLADFGIGKTVSEPNTDHVTVQAFRSGVYAPPETTAPYRFVRDVYSFGVVMLQIMHREKLNNFHELESALASIKMPVSLRELLERCISPDPADRPRDGSILHQELLEFKSRAQSQNTARANHGWLRITAAARRHLTLDGKSDVAAEAALMTDIASAPSVSYRFDPDLGSYDHQTIFLVGDSRRYVLKPDDATGELTVTSAVELSFEELESYRRRALSVTGWISWTTTRPAPTDTAIAGLRALQSALDDYYAGVAQPDDSNGESAESDELLDTWHRILQAREELSRGDLKTLSYERKSAHRREFVVEVTAPPEVDLMGTQWEVRPTKDSRHYLSRVEVVLHQNHVLGFIHLGKTVSVPAKGVLVPYLGPSQVALQRQLDAVALVRGSTGVQPDLKSVLAHPERAVPPRSVAEPDWVSELDLSKKTAIRGALGSDQLLLIKGPPGTGKTKLISELVLQTLKTNPDSRILIVSQTHIAVDNALERLDQLAISGLVRLGAPDDPRISQSIDHLRLDRQMTKWAAQVRRRAEAQLERVAAVNKLSANHLRAALCLQQLATVAREREAVERAREVATPGVTESSLAMTLEVSVDPVDLEKRLTTLGERYDRLLEDANTWLAGDLTLTKSLSADEAQAAVDVILGTATSSKSLLRLVELQGEWLERIASDENLAASFLQTSRVISGTCLGFLRHNAVRNLSIDLCIVDEASKATSTEVLVPMSRAKRVILVGDDNQLSPLDEDLIRRADLLEEYDLSPEVVRETLFQRLSDRLPSSCKYSLTDQYRMIQPIGDLISTCFYGGELQSPRKVGLDGYQVLGAPVLWLSTTRFGDRRREHSDAGFSYSNRAEAQTILNRLHTVNNAILNGTVKMPASHPVLDVLLIAPYRSQVEELRRRLASFRSTAMSLRVESVDAVQGREADLTLFSVTRSNASAQLGFLGLNHWRRVNVALSRARFGLTIVGDAEFCASLPGALRDVLQYIGEHPQTCELRELADV